MIYHARDYKEIQGHELSDPNRNTRARVLEWTESGFPDFLQNIGDQINKFLLVQTICVKNSFSKI